MRNGRRAKRNALLAILVTSGTVLILGNLTWFTVEVGGQRLEVVGQDAAPPLSGLALAGMALAGALSLAPLILRLILGGLQVALSALSLTTALPALSDPSGRVLPRVTETTGVAGDDAVRALVDAVDPTPWPAVIVVLAVGGVLAGLWVLVTARSWPVPGRRYEQAAAPSDEAPAPDRSEARSREDEWDALTRGEDPTRPGSS